MTERGLYFLLTGLFATAGLAVLAFYRRYTDWSYRRSYKMILPSIRRRIEEGKEQRQPPAYWSTIIAGILALVAALVFLIFAFVKV